MNAISPPRLEPDIVAAQRAELWDAGYRPLAVYGHDLQRIAVKDRGKRPKGDDWQLRARRNPPEAVDAPAEPDALNTGILCDGLRALDLDVDDPAVVSHLRALAFNTLGEAPIRTRDNSPRCLILYAAAEGEPSKRTLAGTVGKVEVLGRGQQFVGFGFHPSGALLRWHPEAPITFARDTLPVITEQQVTAFLSAAASVIGADERATRTAASDGVFPHSPSPHGQTADPLDISAALAALPNDGAADWEWWNKIGMATWAATGGSMSGFAAWVAWSERHPEHDPAQCRDRWTHYRDAPPTQIGAGSLFHLAREARPGWSKPTDAHRHRSEAREGEDGAPAVDIPAEFSDESLAMQFSEQHADALRYVAAWGEWYEWTGTVWRTDDTLRVFDLARRLCRQASAGCDKDRVAATVASAKTVAAVERLAKADRRHASTIEQWDSDPWLLNTPGGTVDLRTGKMRHHAPGDHITKSTAVAPGGNCPLWRNFLHTVTAGDEELQRYLQRMAGYCLTGSIREHALFFAYGTGGNGKGVMINTLTGIMADYATVASMETFTASTTDRHPADLAMLRGARLVTAQETEEGRRWAESRIKALTGGDPITARFMRQDFFTFQPVFKLLIAGNHRPGLRSVDEAIRRRMNQLPFTVSIPAEERDLDLPEKLRAEWPGILKWAIEGCLEWQRGGLAAPPAVIEATAEYLESEDAMGAWLEECTTRASTFHSQASELYSSWKAWADAAGELPGSQKRFSQALGARGFVAERIPHVGRAGFRGLAVKPDAAGHRYGE